MIPILRNPHRLDAVAQKHRRKNERVTQALVRARRLRDEQGARRERRLVTLFDMGFSASAAREAVLTKDERVHRLLQRGMSLDEALEMVHTNMDGGLDRALIAAWFYNQHPDGIKRRGNRAAGRKRKKANSRRRPVIFNSPTSFFR